MLDISQLREGAQLRVSRVARGLTLFEVGRLADVSPPRLSEFERGRPSLSMEAVERVRLVLASEPASSRPSTAGEAERVSA